MKKLLLLATSVVMLNLCTAQTYDTTTFYGKMNFVFNHINKSAIPTGLLWDYGIDFGTLTSYPGTVLNDTNWVTLPDFRVLYASLYSQQITTSPTMQSLDTVNSTIGSYASSTQPITFTCLFYNFNMVDSNAVTKNLFTVSNGQVYDVAGRTQSPYLQQSVFAIAPTVQSVTAGNISFIFRPQLFYGNTGKQVSTIQIDPFGTNTYQSCTFNTAFAINYSTEGIYPVNIKVTYTDGTVRYSHTKLAIYAAANTNMVYLNRRHKTNNIFYGPPFMDDDFIYGIRFPIIAEDTTATKAFLGVKAVGDYSVDYSMYNTSGKIKKPLIVVDGFDPGAVSDYTGYQYLYDYIPDINADENYSTYHPIPLNSTSGLDNVDSFDVVYVHWHNGMDYIERNAYLLETIIQYVNHQKQLSGSTQQNVIIGLSMGGLVVRYALRDMERNNIPHQTRLFISHDAPHWGANVPPAYQALVQYVAPWKIVNLGFTNTAPYITMSYQSMVPETASAIQIFNSPAAQEMLLQRYLLNGTPPGYSLLRDSSMHHSFMDTLNTMGWPQNCRNIVLSNGACNGTPAFANNSEMVGITGKNSWTYFGALYRSLVFSIVGSTAPALNNFLTLGTVPVSNTSLLVQFPLSLISTKSTINFNWGAWAVPASGTSTLFLGDISVQRKLLFLININSYIMQGQVNSTSDMLPLDNAPGGQYSLTQFGVNFDTITAKLHQYIGNWVNLNVFQPNFCFVPTASALALNNPQQLYNASFCSNIACYLPTQVSDYYAPQVNQLHISYTTDNSNWILQRQAASFSCLKVCNANLGISGPAVMCTPSASYSLTSAPTGSTVQWGTSPSGIASTTANNTQVTLTKLTTGQLSLSASITNACYVAPVTIPVSIGGPPINIASSQQGGCNNGYQTWQLSASPATNGSSWYWYVGHLGTNSAIDIMNSSGSSILADVKGGGTIEVNYNDACGVAQTNGVTVYSNCPLVGAIIVSPNPARGTITITSNASQPVSKAGAAAPALDVEAATAQTITGGKKLAPQAQNSDPGTLIQQVKMYDVTGKLVKLVNFSTPLTQVNVDVHDLVPGTYFIEIYNGKTVSRQTLLIINHYIESNN